LTAFMFWFMSFKCAYTHTYIYLTTKHAHIMNFGFFFAALKLILLNFDQHVFVYFLHNPLFKYLTAHEH